MKKFYSVILWGICIAAAVGLLILLGSLMSDEAMVAEKPVIYLYPEQEQEVSVRLDYDGELTCTYPEYKDGWTVTANRTAGLQTGRERNTIICTGKEHPTGSMISRKGSVSREKIPHSFWKERLRSWDLPEGRPMSLSYTGCPGWRPMLTT